MYVLVKCVSSATLPSATGLFRQWEPMVRALFHSATALLLREPALQAPSPKATAASRRRQPALRAPLPSVTALFWRREPALRAQLPSSMARDPAHSAPLPSATRSEALGLPPLFVALPFEQGCRLLPPSGHALVEGMINLAIPQTHVLRSLPFCKVLLVLVYWATGKSSPIADPNYCKPYNNICTRYVHACSLYISKSSISNLLNRNMCGHQEQSHRKLVSSNIDSQKPSSNIHITSASLYSY